MTKPFESPRIRRVALLAVIALAGGALLLAVLARLAAGPLQQRIVAALGPQATIGSIAIGWRGVELHGLRIAAGARGWPAADELRAQRVRVVPDPRSLWAAAFGGPWRVRRVEIDGAYLSLHRGRDGALRVLPSLLDAPGPRDAGRAAAAPPPPSVVIAELSLTGASVELHDGSLGRGAAHRVRLDGLDASIGPLHLPALDVPIDVHLAGWLKGPRHDGRIAIDGRLTPASRDATLAVRAAGVDLVALQPYLLRVNEGGVKSGRLDLELNAVVKAMKLHAPGTVTLTDLELAAGGGMLGTLAGAPRQAVLAAMKRDGRIVVRFTLDGRIDDPAFSVNENLAMRVAAGLGESLGISVGGAVEGVASVIKGLLGR